MYNKRTTQMITVLLTCYEKEAVAEEVILKELNISNNTLRHLIEEIDVLITPASLYSSHHHVFFTKTSNISLRFCLSAILRANLENKLLLTLFFRNGLTLAELSEILFVSESTVKRAIKRINTFFGSTDITIQSRPFRVTGNESTIRLFYTMLFSELFELDKLPFEQADKVFLTSYFDIFNHFFLTKKTRQDYLNFLLISLVSLEREKNGFPITSFAAFQENTSSMKQKLDDMQKSKKMDLFYKEIPITNIFYLFLSENFIPKSSAIIKQETYEQKKRMHSIFLFLNDVEKLFNIKTSALHKETVSKKLYEIVYGFLNIPIDLILPTNQYILFYKFNNFFSNKAIPIAEKMIDKHFDGISKTSYPLILFCLATNYSSIFEQIKANIGPIRLKVYIDFDFDFSNYIKTVLTSALDDNIRIELVGEKKYTNIDNLFDDCDLLITNVFFETTETKIIGISRHLTELDLKFIKDTVLKMYYEKIATYFTTIEKGVS